jgi:Domain of unknown function (DUF1840)
MIVSFHTNMWSSITMFGDVAVTMLKMAGLEGAVPGRLAAKDVPPALSRLQNAMTIAGGERKATKVPRLDDDEDEATPMELAMRMGGEHPLVQLLRAAAKTDCEVTWNEGAPPI